jgi:hypothetical protein
VALDEDDICREADLLDLRRAAARAMWDRSDMLNPDTPSPSWLIRKLQSKTAQGRMERTLATLEYTEGLLRGAKRALQRGEMDAPACSKLLKLVNAGVYRMCYAQARILAVRDTSNKLTLLDIERSEAVRFTASWWQSAAQASMSMRQLMQQRSKHSHEALSARPAPVAPPKKKHKVASKPNSALLAAVAKLASSQSKMLKTIGGLKAGRTPKVKPVKPPKLPRKVAAANTTTAAAPAARIPPSHGGCAHCKAKGYTGWEWHVKAKCYELVPAIRPADYVMRKDRP